MIDPVLGQILLKAFTYGVCGSLTAGGLKFFHRQQSGPRLDQSLAVGFLIGASFGAFFGIFESLLIRR